MLIMPKSNDLSLGSWYTMKNLVKIHYLSMMSQNNHLNQRDRVNKFVKLSPWIMLSLHLKPKLGIKLANHFELGAK